MILHMAQPMSAIDSATEGEGWRIRGHRIRLDWDMRDARRKSCKGGLNEDEAGCFGLGYQLTEQVVAVQWPCVALHRHHS